MEGGVAAPATVAARVRVPASGWQDAIRAACAPLLGTGAVSAHYVERCVALVTESGPYIVIAPGIALAHARPEDGAQRLALSVAVLDRPVTFGHPSNDPVDLVFAFASPDKDAHVGLLAALTRGLVGGLAARLREAASDAEAAARLHEVLDNADHN